MPSPLRVSLSKAQELLGERLDRGAMIYQSISSGHVTQRDRWRHYNRWKMHNAELLGTIVADTRYRTSYLNNTEEDHDFFELEDKRNVDLMLEQIQDETNYLSSLEELLPVLALKETSAPAEVELDLQASPVIFIGHGRSAVWKDLRDFIRDRLKMPFEEFNRVSTAGISVTDRLSEMLVRANLCSSCANR
jgi:hypothetical protein